MKKSFLLKSNWIGVFDKLSAEQAGLLIKLLYHYNVDGTEPEEIDDAAVSAYFDLMKLEIAVQESEPENDEKKRGAPKGSRNNPNGRKGGKITNSELNKTNLTNSELNKTNSELVNFENAPHVNNININKHAHVSKLKKTNSELVNFSFDDFPEAFSEAEEHIANWNCFMAKWQELCESKTVKAEMPTWLETPSWCLQEFKLRVREYGLEGLLRAVDKIRASPFFKVRKIGLKMFLLEKTIPTLESGGYDWNPDEPKGKQTPNKQKTYELDEQALARQRAEYDRLFGPGREV